MAEFVDEVEIRAVKLPDPSDYHRLFEILRALLPELPEEPIDLLLSAGTPQAQTLWVILVQSGLLKARMLQVIPPRFVPHPHPSPVKELHLDIEGFPEIRALRAELTQLRARVSLIAGGLVGEAPAMQRLAQRMMRVAVAEVPVLILGETGVGKERVARAVHEASPRAQGPFVAENCGAFAEGVLESELFGHEQGAFTGAHRQRRGLFEQAEGGTLFLDELVEMSPATQVRLLRVLQERQIRRLGGEELIRVDVRVLAATHQDLRAEIQAGRFREDLYYRLNGAVLEIPPLRERLSDLEPLIQHFLKHAGRADLQLSRAARSALHRYPWPGNVRELEAEVRRWLIFCDEGVQLEDLAPEIQALAEGAILKSSLTPLQSISPLAVRVRALELEIIQEALARCDGNISAAARALKIDRGTLTRKLKR